MKHFLKIHQQMIAAKEKPSTNNLTNSVELTVFDLINEVSLTEKKIRYTTSVVEEIAKTIQMLTYAPLIRSNFCCT